MEIRQVSALLRVSTIAKEAGLFCYASLLDQVADVGPQPAFGAETTRISPGDQVSQEPNLGESNLLLLAAGHANLLKSDWVMAGKMTIYSGQPNKAKPFIKDFKNQTQLMANPEKI